MNSMRLSGEILCFLILRCSMLPETAGVRPRTISESANRFDKGEKNCCACSAVDVDALDGLVTRVSEWLTGVVPGKWFLDAGALIGSLRYGSPARRLPSGTLQLVDNDIDIAVFAPESKRTSVAQSLRQRMPAGFWYANISEAGQENFFANHYLPLSCTDEDKTKPVQIDVMFIFEYDNGTFEVDPNRGWYYPYSVIQDLLPLRQVKWGHGVAWVPNNYMMYAATEHNSEYGKNGMWRDLWKPKVLFEDFPKFCKNCVLTESDHDAIKESIRGLHAAGYASWIDLMDPEHSKKDTKQVALTDQVLEAN